MGNRDAGPGGYGAERPQMESPSSSSQVWSAADLFRSSAKIVSGKKKSISSAGTRTLNLPLRRRAPYPFRPRSHDDCFVPVILAPTSGPTLGGGCSHKSSNLPDTHRHHVHFVQLCPRRQASSTCARHDGARERLLRVSWLQRGS